MGKRIENYDNNYIYVPIKLTLSNDLKSYSLMLSELTPAAKIKPSGSYAATGRPDKCINP